MKSSREMKDIAAFESTWNHVAQVFAEHAAPDYGAPTRSYQSRGLIFRTPVSRKLNPR